MAFDDDMDYASDIDDDNDDCYTYNDYDEDVPDGYYEMADMLDSRNVFGDWD